MERLDVLVVDDDVATLRALARLLGRRHEVRVATRVDEALGHIARKVPDVLLCDFEMPDKNGDALLADLATRHPRVRRVLYTGASGRIDECEGLVHASLLKPAGLAALLEAIEGDGDGKP